MNRIASTGVVCAVTILWSIHNSADTLPPFPEPIEGHQNELVFYDDFPPHNPATIDVGPIKVDANTMAVPGVPNMNLHDGIEIVGTLHAIANSKAKAACIAVDITRQFGREYQLIASHSDFFELNNGTTAFHLPVRFPNCDEPMQITLLAILLDEDGVPAGNESILAKSTFTRAKP